MLQVDLRAQLMLPHFIQLQSAAENKPRLDSAAAFPISIVRLFLPLPGTPPGRSLLHRLQCVLRAKFKFLQLQNTTRN